MTRIRLHIGAGRWCSNALTSCANSPRTASSKELRDELIVQAIDAWETSECDQADALCERLEYALNNEP